MEVVFFCVLAVPCLLLFVLEEASEVLVDVGGESHARVLRARE